MKFFSFRLTLLCLFPMILLNGISCTRECDCADPLSKIKKYRPEEEYFTSSMKSLHFLIETRSIKEVDSLFNIIRESYDLPVDAGAFPDGNYRGSSPEDAFGYFHIADFRVKDGRITELDYNEIKQEGQGKQEDEDYCEEMSITGTTPAEAYPIMEKELMETQDLMEINAVSGATYSLYRLQYAVMVALMNGPQ